MGMITDERVASWQREAGIEPATGEYARALQALSQAAFDAIKIIELERSGIRDGAGYWHGSDVIGAMAQELMRLAEDAISNAPRSDDARNGATSK